jgi:hypothetical protein
MTKIDPLDCHLIMFFVLHFLELYANDYNLVKIHIASGALRPVFLKISCSLGSKTAGKILLKMIPNDAVSDPESDDSPTETQKISGEQAEMTAEPPTNPAEQS